MMFAKRGGRVGHEAAALAAACGHPGVVELVGADEGVLRTRMVDGRPLAELDPLAPEEVAGVAGAVATTLADLHELGVVHGAVDAGHVLVRVDGRVVLCSLGRGGEPADDVAALGHLVARLLAGAAGDGATRSWRPGRRPPSGRRRHPGQPPPGRGPEGAADRRPVRARERVRARLGLRSRLGPMLQPPAAPALAALAAQATDSDPRRRPAARDFAAAIHQQVPTARIPRPKPRPLVPGAGVRPAGVSRPRRPRTGLTAVLFLLALIAYGGVIALVTSALSDHGRGRPPTGRVPERVGLDGTGDEEAAAGPGEGGANGDGGGGQEVPAATTPMATRVWPPEPFDYAGGVLTMGGVRYALGQPGDAVAAGDWGCTGRRTLVLLRPSNGEVFAFDGWADAGDPLAGRRLGRVAGASGLRAVDTDGDGCDDLELERPGRPPVHLEVRS